MRIRARAPLRLRLTLAFALAMAAVLAGLGGFLQVRLGAELLRGIDLELRSRAGVITAGLAEPGPLPINAGRNVIDPDEAFGQVLDPTGRILDASEAVRAQPVLPAATLREVTAPTFLTRRVPGVDDPARLLAVPGSTRGRSVVVVVGANLGDRSEALDRLRLLLVIGIPAAVLLASVAGWLVAGAALRPVEQIRSEAAAISHSAPDRRLTVPDTGDELARLADTLNLLLSRQQDSLEREHRFVDEASHELRTPLAILKAELDLAVRRPRSQEELTATVRTAAEETDRLVALAEELLVLARSRPGHLPVRRESVSLRQFLEDSAAPFRSRAAAVSSRITVAGPDEPVRVDPVRLRQAVHNLLDNALRYGEGSPVVITGARRDGAVEIMVADGGPGFPAQMLQHAFEPFTRASPSDSDAPKRGAGLGLAIVRAVAEAHAGHAAATNPPTGGARVDIVIPA